MVVGIHVGKEPKLSHLWCEPQDFSSQITDFARSVAILSASSHYVEAVLVVVGCDDENCIRIAGVELCKGA
jgi:hypothetical protein